MKHSFYWPAFVVVLNLLEICLHLQLLILKKKKGLMIDEKRRIEDGDVVTFRLS